MSAARSRSSTVSPLTLTESFMEFVGRPRPSEACSLLAVPAVNYLLDVNEDDADVIIGIRPKSSPIPSRKSSFTDEDSEPEPEPFPSGSRRVSFADAKGLSLVQVKKFDTWVSPNPPAYDSTSTDGPETQEFFLLPLTFSLPVPDNELFARVQEQKLELETIELLPGTTILKGVIRVLNVSFDKSVYVRTTLDNWCTHFDLLAEYIPGSSDGVMDGFLFKLALAPPFRDQRARVDFCLRYETPMGTFWANNNNNNYVVVCQKDKGQRDNVNKKSCLKTVSQNVSTVENIASKTVSSRENKSTDECVGGPEEDLMRAQNISEGQSGSSGEEEQKLPVESGQSSSRRRQRKAARTARERDYFTQRHGGESDRDESPPEINQATQGEHVCVSEGGGESGRPPLVSEALKTHCQPPHKTHEQPEKPEPLARRDVQNKGSEAAPADHSILGVLSRPEEGTPDTAFTCTTNTASVSTDSLTPLTGQGCLDPVSTEDPSRPPETRQSGDVGPSDSRNKSRKHFCESQELNCMDTNSSGEEERNEGKRSNQMSPNTCQGQKRPPGDSSELNSALATDLLNPHTSSESVHAQEVNLTFDPQRQTSADPQEQILTSEMLEMPAGVEKQHGTEINSPLNGDARLQELDEDFSPCEKDRIILTCETFQVESSITEERSEGMLGPNAGEVPSVVEEVVSDQHGPGDRPTEGLTDKSILDKMEHPDIEAAVPKQNEDLFLSDNKETKNWEVMIENDEKRGFMNNEGHEPQTQAEEEDTTNISKEKPEAEEGEDEEQLDTMVTEEEEGLKEEEDVWVLAGKGADLEHDEVMKAEKTDGAKVKDESETEMLQVTTDGKSIRKQKDTKKNMKTRLNYEGVKQKNQTGMMSVAAEDRDGDSDQRSEVPKHRAGDGLSALMSNDLQVEDTREGERAPLLQEEGFQRDRRVAHDRSNNNSSALASPAEPEGEQTSQGSSAESDSDDELELYMHCLRAAGAPAQGFPGSRRASVSRGKGPPPLMPSINESVDEEGSVPLEIPDMQTAASAREQERIGLGMWKNTSSFCCISKAFFCTTLLVVFLVVAYHYDFLACFGLYLMSVIWLCCQKDRRPAQNHNKEG